MHGFPDSSKLWERQVPSLVEAGWRVVAPDLRGFGKSSRPREEAAYRLSEMQADVVAILDALGVHEFDLVGHDWGSALAWRMAGALPHRVRRLVAVSVGHPGAAWGAGGSAQRARSWYFLFFQYRGAAETLLAASNFKLFRDFLGDGCPQAQADRYISELSQPGALTAGLNYYRANFQLERFAATEPARSMAPIRCPVLGIWGSKDFGVLEKQMTASTEYVPAHMWRYARIEGAGHWVPYDAPDELNRLLLGFLSQPMHPVSRL
ncbi:hypothetical protein WJX81_005414 [Elliptochloris bilobata]|uniref:AB hydrolase-1 domain-containing protein n=1 Tax=Elliptochloris bilobata TaxID=381761 RepID=A0AAW1S0I6_9CHLO